MHEQFTCEECGRTGHLRQLTHRETEPGDYCPACGNIEKCAACGERDNKQLLLWQPEAKNYLCSHCMYEKNERVKSMIRMCSDWLQSEKKKQRIPAHRVLSTWLFESKHDWRNRYRQKEKVLQRLQQYREKIINRLLMHEQVRNKLKWQ